MKIHFWILSGLAVLLAVASPTRSFSQSTGSFCDDFEDGSGIPTRWDDHNRGGIISISSTVHSGAMAIALTGTVDSCLRWMHRVGFSASTGEYSAQMYNGKGTLYFQVQESPDNHPSHRAGYAISLSEPTAPESFRVIRFDGNDPNGSILSSSNPQFPQGQWTRGFARLYGGGLIVAGFEIDGIIDSVVVTDPNPICGDGQFYVAACDPGSTSSFIDDVCFDSFSCAANTCPDTVVVTDTLYIPVGDPCVFEAGDVDSSGAVDVLDVVNVVGVAFRNAPPIPNPCNRKYTP